MKLKIADDLSLPVDAATQTFAFIGRKGSGKSYGAGKLTELLIDAGVQVAILDTVGNWHGLRLAADGKTPGIDIPILGGLRGDIPMEAAGGALIADALVDSGRSMVIDASQFSKADRQRFAAALGQQLWRRKKAERQPTPLHLILEESQLIVPETVRGDAAVMVGTYEEIIRLGRNYGIGVTMITQRPQSVNKEVLNQTECLMVFQVNGAHERKALKEWIVHQGMDVKLLDELPSLRPGECYVWSPQWLQILQRVKIAAKRTFDSTSTPKVGAGTFRGRDLKAIDLQDLQAKMAASIERAKADDPRELRKRIAELERHIKERPLQAVEKIVEKRVEVPVLKNGMLDKALALVDRLQAVAGPLTVAVQRVSKMPDQKQAPQVQAQRPVAAKVPESRATIPSRIPSRTQAGGDGALPIGEQKTLGACIQYPDGLLRNQLTVLTGYKRSTRDAYIARLREKGLVEPSGDLVLATDAGVAALPHFEPLPVGQALQDWWRARLPQGELAVLNVLIQYHPNGIDRGLIDEATGFKRSTRDAYLSRLAAKQLVEDAGRGEVRASDELF